MVIDASIVIATFGDSKWMDIADNIAVPSVIELGFPIIRIHGGSSIAEARNTGAGLVKTKWICFLDADDTLSNDYFNYMSNANGDLRIPRLKFIDPATREITEPFDLTQRDINVGNPCPIGTLVKTDDFHNVGGFWEEPVYEDWSLFRRLWLKGATLEHTNAIYYAYNLGGRNKSVENPRLAISNIIESHNQWIGAK